MKPEGARILVAGVGNVFLGDDGFGVEVAKRMRERPGRAEVHVEDFGIRGVHLAYELLEGYEVLILVDAASRGEPPGSVFVVEPDLENSDGADNPFLVDAHGLDPELVFAMVANLGGRVPRVWIVCCEPVEVVERMGLGEKVAAAVDEAIALVDSLVDEELERKPAAKARG
jgi:hydrogenase maturation protease